MNFCFFTLGKSRGLLIIFQRDVGLYRHPVYTLTSETIIQLVANLKDMSKCVPFLSLEIYNAKNLTNIPSILCIDTIRPFFCFSITIQKE